MDVMHAWMLSIIPILVIIHARKRKKKLVGIEKAALTATAVRHMIKMMAAG